MLGDDTWAARTARVLGVDPEMEWQDLKAAYLGVELGLCTNHPLAADWARFFLGTHFEMTEARHDEVTCFFFYGAVNKGALHDLVQSAAQTLRVQLDRRRQATRWVFGPGRSLVVSDDAEAWYVVDRDAGRFVFLSPADDAPALREAARQVRSIVAQLLFVNGWLPVHASAVVANGIGILLPGDQGAGKSTTMLELLGSGSSVAFLSNDRTFARCQDGAFRVAGWPQTVRLGAGSVESNPRLKPHLHAWEHFHATLLPLADQVSHPDKLDLTAREFSNILGCEYEVVAPVRVIAFPRLVWEPGRSTLRLLSPEEGAQRVAETTRFPDPEGDTWAGTLLFPKADDAIDAECASIASSVSFVEVSGTAAEMASSILHHSETVTG